MTEPEAGISGGIDTHKDLHVAAVVDQTGRIRDVGSFPATTAGYRQLLAWMRRHGELIRVGIEGTDSYGAGLARHLSDEHVEVVDVNRPNRQTRRRRGKNDSVDAKPPPAPHSTAMPPPHPRPTTGSWSRSGPCGSHSARHATPAPGSPTSSEISSSVP